MFNTLKYVKMMEESGFSRSQAETSVGVLVEVMDEKFATRQDMQDVRQEIQSLRQEMAFRFAEMRNELLVKMGAMMAASMTITVAVLAVLMNSIVK